VQSSHVYVKVQITLFFSLNLFEVLLRFPVTIDHLGILFLVLQNRFVLNALSASITEDHELALVSVICIPQSLTFCLKHNKELPSQLAKHVTCYNYKNVL
jgi:hypothetical protein